MSHTEVPFVHIHNHSSYSWDSVQSVEQIAKTAKERGMKAVALTDHGFLSGAYKFVNACEKEDIKPLIGMEAYYVPDATEGKKDDRLGAQTHLLLLAKNQVGYRNLSRLAQYSFTEGGIRSYGWEYNRIDDAALEQWHEGIIATSTCLASPMAKLFARGDEDDAIAWAHKMIELFGDDFFFEVGGGNNEEQKQYNDELIIPLAKKLNVPIVYGSDAHMIDPKDLNIRVQKMCIEMGKRKGKIMLVDEFPFDAMEYEHQWLHDGATALKYAQAIGLPKEAITNTAYLADKIEGDFFKAAVNAPDLVFQNMTEGNARIVLREKALSGLAKMMKVDSFDECPEEYKSQLLRELDLIQNFKYTSYFLQVEDYINTARQAGIPVGPARGSGAGFLLCWALGIISPRIDPIKYGLYSERFINPGRVTATLDFSADGF
jgi:DNA polymerase-3 subunit alpha